MNREELKSLGLTDEQIEGVMASHGKTVNSIKEKADKVDSLQSQIDDYKQQIKDRDNQLADLGKKVKNNEELTEEIERLKDENKTATEELQEKLEKQAFEFSLEKALNKAGAKNPKAVKALLDTESIKVDGETLLGLDDQLKALRESDAYLFGEDIPSGLKGRNPHEGGGDPSTNITQEQFNKMSYTEKVKMYNEDLELYQKLSKGE